MVTTGTLSKGVAISTNLFQDLPDYVDNFRVKYTLYGGAEPNGESFTKFTINKSPKGGNCTVYPERGVTTLNKWNVSCVDWQDPEGIASYKYYGNCGIYSLDIDINHAKVIRHS